MASNKNLRKKSVVNVQVQWTLALRVILHFFAFVCAGAVFGIINQCLADPFGGIGANVSKFLQNSGPMLLALVCMLPIFVRDTLTLSNRIAGPIYNLRDKIRRHGEGETDVPDLRFRDKDMWSDLPDLFNTMVTELKQQPANAPVTEAAALDVAESRAALVEA